MTDDQIIDPTFELVHGPGYDDQNEWERVAREDIVNEGPIQLDIELNTTCNYKCIMCFHSFDPPEPEMISLEDVKRLISEGMAIGVKSLKLNYRGEPLLYPFLIDVIRYAKKVGILEVAINTNASLLSYGMSTQLVLSGLDRLICSIDSIVPGNYERIRRGGRLNLIIENLNTLNFIKKNMESKKPIVRVQMVHQDINSEEVKDYISFWEKKVDEISIAEVKDYTGNIEDYTPLPNWYCSQPWQRLFILADGTVLPCCRAMRGGNQAFYKLGNVKDTHIKTIWKGRKLQLLRSGHRAGNSHFFEMCRRCGLRKEVVKKNV